MRLIHRLPGSLAAKIDGILVVFFLFALTMIGLTLYVGRQLEGGAAAINEAGALRMRTYRIGYLIEQSLLLPGKRRELLQEAETTMREFGAAIDLIDVGDTERPLFLPRETAVREQMERLKQHWRFHFEPLLQEAFTHITDAPQSIQARNVLHRIDDEIRNFVPEINQLVLQIEKSNAHHTDLMWSFQNALVGFALAGTLLLLYLFRMLIIEPVERLRQGMESMAQADFSTRLPIDRHDEFGDLALGFNHMADHLQELYSTLEKRVKQKTHDLAVRARELGLLYEVTASLSEPAELGQLARGVLERVRDLFEAHAWAVRLIDEKNGSLSFVAVSNLPEELLISEKCLPVGVCLCGNAAATERPFAGCPRPDGDPRLLLNCYREGFQSVVAIPVRAKNRVLGIFNLFFSTPRKFEEGEIRLLETVGRHLGVAIENLQLAEREKEMAVSEERNLLAQELHDSIAQGLAFLNIQAQMLEASLRQGDVTSARAELVRIREGIQESYDNVRELLVHFRIRIEHTDLVEAIENAAQKFEGQTGIAVYVERSGEAPAVQPTTLLQILHIVQEALSNVRKHAQARRVTISLVNSVDALMIEIADDGTGFALAANPEKSTDHVGIGIMRDRARRIGALCQIESRPNAGTCVRLVLPKVSR
ncbi:type IV pili methyl-accepting chemotaxis transducer N-terminal domain-containing protein [Sulfuricystis multivorans]|uniref:type IV pili methyl-accepting chemotaxis transducer N-terminal domain-containing protein n=1 Tax=Sulfuricystis multivorans TaxID=2211108 RepID=UPI000F843C78|nr:type IV pili methyl-accepting chemotaxis transducer N-terminal domain-containing protein [Sulfuricystis multivorans]